MKNDYKNWTINDKEWMDEHDGKNRWRDQTVWRQMHLKFYPRIKIDSLSKIWTRVDIWMNDL